MHTSHPYFRYNNLKNRPILQQSASAVFLCTFIFSYTCHGENCTRNFTFPVSNILSKMKNKFSSILAFSKTLKMALYCIPAVLYCTVLYTICTVLYCTVYHMYCTVLYTICTVLYCIPSGYSVNLVDVFGTNK